MIRFVCFLLIMIAVLSSPVDVQAADFEVTPILGYTFGGSVKDSETDDSFDFDDSVSYGVILGLRDESKKGSAFYEILYSHQPTYLKVDDKALFDKDHLDVDINYFHFGGRFGTDGEMVNPYVVAGVGVTYFDVKGGDSETKFSFSIGGGVNVPLSQHISLRFEGRGFGTVLDNDSSAFCVNNQCLVDLKGEVLWQYTGFSGLVFSF